MRGLRGSWRYGSWQYVSWRRLALRVGILAAVVWLSWGFVTPHWRWPVTEAMKQSGRELFVHVWEANDAKAHGDGLGPVFNASSCVACHFQGGVGGGGDYVHNVTAFEVHPTTRERKLQNGLVHMFAVNESLAESRELLKVRFPVIPGGDRVVGGCTIRFEDFDPVRVETTNSIALFGDGLIDRLSDSAIRLSHARTLVTQSSRELSGDFTTAGSGRARILPGGRLGKFGWKAQFATLEEFVAAACANELGLGNPLMKQARPLATKVSYEKPDLTRKEFRELVAFVESIPRPRQVLPDDAHTCASAKRGEKLFAKLGCADCHTPDVGNVAGIYSDLLLHTLASDHGDGYRHEIIVEVPLPSSHPRPDEWRTPPLWGVADSAPYFHDGSAASLLDAILRHGGEASAVTKAFSAMPEVDRQAVVDFLGTLRAPEVERASVEAGG